MKPTISPGDDEDPHCCGTEMPIEPAPLRVDGPDTDRIVSAEPQATDLALATGKKDEAPGAGDKQPEERASKGKLLWFSDHLTAFRSIIVDTIIVGLLLAIIPYLIIQIFHRSVILDQIDVPKTVQERRFTPLYVSRRLVDEAQLIQSSSIEPAARRRLLEPSWLEQDIEIPGGGISLHSFVGFVKSEIGVNDVHITGELRQDAGEAFVLVLRNSDTDQMISTKPALLKDIDTLFTEGGVALIKLTDPYLLASAAYAREAKQNEYPDTISLIKASLATRYQLSASRAYNLWGNVLAARGYYDEAIEKYQLASRQERPFAEIYANWGDLLAAMGRAPEAISKYTAATQLDGKLSSAYLGRGDVEMEQGDYRGALENYGMARDIDRARSWPHFDVATAYAALGNFKSAEKELQLAREAAEVKTFAVFGQTDLSKIKVDISDEFRNWAGALAWDLEYDFLDAIQKLRIAITADTVSTDAHNMLGNHIDQFRKI